MSLPTVRVQVAGEDVLRTPDCDRSAGTSSETGSPRRRARRSTSVLSSGSQGNGRGLCHCRLSPQTSGHSPDDCCHEITNVLRKMGWVTIYMQHAVRAGNNHAWHLREQIRKQAVYNTPVRWLLVFCGGGGVCVCQYVCVYVCVLP